jgi:hypothetical protein
LALELKKSGLEGDMDVLRARAYLDLLLSKDSRPRQDGAAAPAASPAGGAAPGGFAGRVTLTVPLTNLTRLADRPGELSGIGPVDPNPGANTSNRYQNGHQPNPALGRISVPDRCPRTAVASGGHARCHAAGNLLRDDRQMRAARLPSCLI